MAKKPRTYPLRYVEDFLTSPTTSQSNYRNVRREIIFHHPVNLNMGTHCYTARDRQELGSYRVCILSSVASTKPESNYAARPDVLPLRTYIAYHNSLGYLAHLLSRNDGL